MFNKTTNTNTTNNTNNTNKTNKMNKTNNTNTINKTIKRSVQTSCKAMHVQLIFLSLNFRSTNICLST